MAMAMRIDDTEITIRTSKKVKPERELSRLIDMYDSVFLNT